MTHPATVPARPAALLAAPGPGGVRPPAAPGCRAPARRILGRRVRYVIGAEPGQVQGRRWRRG